MKNNKNQMQAYVMAMQETLAECHQIHQAKRMQVLRRLHVCNALDDDNLIIDYVDNCPKCGNAKWAVTFKKHNKRSGQVKAVLTCTACKFKKSDSIIEREIRV
jgi:hypothetical protein